MNSAHDLQRTSLMSKDKPTLDGPTFASFEFDTHTGLTYWTWEFYRLCGMSPEADLPLDEQGIPLAFSPADRARIRALFRDAADTQNTDRLNVEVHLARPDGVSRWLQLLGHPFTDCERRRLNGIALDITERKRFDQSHARVLREQAIFADFSLRVRDVTDIASACDLAATVLARSMDVAFTRVFELLSDQKTFLLRAGAGWPAGFVGVARTAVTRDDPAGSAWHLRRSAIVNNVQTESVFDLPTSRRAVRAVSTMVAIIATGESPFGIIAVDTTETYIFTENDLQFLQSIANVLAATITRIRSDEARQGEDRFTATILNTSATLITVTDRAGRLVRFNPACQRTTGYTVDEVLGHHLSEFVSEDESCDLSRHLTALVEGSPVESVPRENHWLSRKGERRLISWSDTVLCDADSRVEYVISAGLDITERKRLEQEILAISEREQRRIGQDLHDDLGQRLTAIQFLSENLRQDLAEGLPAASALAARIATMAHEANDNARMLARGLCPAAFDAAGLVDALHVLARNTTTLFRIRCECRAENSHPVIAPEAAIQLYRIAQEAVSNAVRHSRATEIVIGWHLDSRCELRVTDNGVGFAVEQKGGEGMGLRSMRYRASLFQGHLCIHSQPGSGTQLICEVPPWLCHLGRENSD